MSSAPTPRRHPQVVHLDELPGHAFATGDRAIAATMKQLGAASAASMIGCTYYEVPPGHSGFPRHYHCVNEEALFVISGSGTLQLGEREVAVRAGDYAAFPAGPDSAHQLRNTGSEVLRYLCFSTMQPTEVVVYPETSTVGVLAAPSSEAARRGEPWVQLMTSAPEAIRAPARR